MFEIDGTLIIFVVSFLIFMFLFDALFLKPVGEAIERRANLIKGDVEASKKLRNESDEIVSNYENHLKKIRSEAQVIINDAVTEAQTNRNKQVGALQEKGRQKIEDARKSLEAEKVTLLESMVDKEIELVNLITSKLIGSSQSVSLDRGKVKKALEEAV